MTSHILHVPANAPKYMWGEGLEKSQAGTRSMYLKVPSIPVLVAPGRGQF